MTTPILGLDEISASQSSKEVTHNTALRQLEGATIRILDRDLTAPPGGESEGDSYLVDSGGTGAWSGKDGQVAVYISGGWFFLPPFEGLRLWINDEDIAIVYDGSSWGVFGGEANTAANVGTGGVGVYKEKSGTELRFKKINAGPNGGITITDDTGDDEVDVDLDISALTAQGSPDGANDYLMIWDDAAGAHRKVLLDNLPGGGATWLSLTDTDPSSYSGQSGKFVKVNAGEDGLEFGTPAGGGDVTGPGSSTDNAIARFNGTGGDTLQDSGIAIDDSDNLQMADNAIVRPELKDYAETRTAPSSSSGTLELDLENGNHFEVTLTESISTLTLSNPPASGKAGAFTLAITQGGSGSYTVSWPGSVQWAGGSAPTLTTDVGAVDILTFITYDAGTTWYGGVFGLDFS
jgi:hypothetical protein